MKLGDSLGGVFIIRGRAVVRRNVLVLGGI